MDLAVRNSPTTSINTASDFEIETTGRFSWRIVNDHGLTVCSLMLDPLSHEVEWVGTHPRYRRKGYARRLWDHAVALGLNPRHSPVRFPEGDAWARAVGGPLPPLDDCL